MHNLSTLPALLSQDLNYSETILFDHTTFLTIQGLARVTRDIILEFVRRQPKNPSEVYDYSLERYGIVRAELAPQYWIGRPDNLAPDLGRRFLEGFLQQFSQFVLARIPVTDLSDLIPRIEETFPKLTDLQRRPYFALYYIYNKCFVDPGKLPECFGDVLKRYDVDVYNSIIGSAAHPFDHGEGATMDTRRTTDNN